MSLRLPNRRIVLLGLAIGLLCAQWASAVRAQEAGGEQADRRRRAAAMPAGPFQVRPGRGEDLFAAYEELAARGRPLFVSSDLVLYGTRRVFDAVTVIALEEALVPRAGDLFAALLDTCLADAEGAPEIGVRRAAASNAVFAAVALALLEGDAEPDERLERLQGGERSRVAERELRSLRAAAARHSPLFGAEAAEQESELAPSPHDTSAAMSARWRRGARALPGGLFARSEKTRRFYLARVYVGSELLALPPAGAALGREELRALRRALHLASVLAGPGELGSIWSEVARLDRLLLGGAEAPGPAQYAADWDQFAAAAGGGSDTLTIGTLDAEPARRFVEMLRARYLESAPADAPAGMSLLGCAPRWDQVAIDALSRADERPLAKGIDLLSLLGSTSARARLETEGDLGMPWFRRALDSLVVHHAAPLVRRARGTEELSASLPRLWLRAMSHLFESPPVGGSDFLRHPGWQTKAAVTGAAFWAGSRGSDTGVGARPAAVAFVRGPAPAPIVHPPYLEPVPALYGDLAAMARGLEATLRSSKRVLAVPVTVLAALVKTLETFERLSYAELAGEWAAGPDAELLAALAGHFRDLEWRLVGANSPAIDRAFLVIRGAPAAPGEERRILVAGAGPPHVITVVVEPGSPAREGAIFSYYEKEMSGDEIDGPQDGALQQRLLSFEPPAFPAWEAEWLVRYQ